MRRRAVRRIRGRRTHRGLRWISGGPSFWSNVKDFFRNHWKAVAILILAIICLILVKVIGGILSGSSIPGIKGICKFDGYKIGVFDSKEEALDNPISNITRELHTIEVSGKGNKKVTTNASLLPIVTKTSSDEFDIDLTRVGDKLILVTVSIGGDGSFFGQFMSSSVENYYFSIEVQPSQNDTNSSGDIATSGGIPEGSESTSYFGFSTSPSDYPTGKFMIGSNVMTTYSSEDAAEAAADESKQALSAKYVGNLPVSSEPSENTARVFVKVSRVGSEGSNYGTVRLDQDNNWSNIMDLSALCGDGNRITLMVKYEDSKVSNCGFQYVSFYLPSAEAVELQKQQEQLQSEQQQLEQQTQQPQPQQVEGGKVGY